MLAVKRKDIKQGRNWVGAGRGPAGGGLGPGTPPRAAGGEEVRLGMPHSAP